MIAQPRSRPPIMLGVMFTISIVYTIIYSTNQIHSGATLVGISYTCIHPKQYMYSFSNVTNVLNSKRDFIHRGRDKCCLCILLIIMVGTWAREGVFCNKCSVWYHKTCEDISYQNMSYIGRSSVVCHCCKCKIV